MKKLFFALLFLAAYVHVAFAQPVGLGFDTASIDNILGATGHVDKKQMMFKVTLPRNDIKISMNGIAFQSAKNLASHFIFRKENSAVKMNGDLILTEDQANVVMSVVLENGLQVLSLHNHFLWETPRILVMHIEGTGTSKKLATALNRVIAEMHRTKSGGGEFPFANIDYENSSIHAQKLNAILGVNGSISNGTYRLEITPKNIAGDDSKMSATLAGSHEMAVMDGELEIHASQLQSALKTLRKAKIDVIAIHQESADRVSVRFYGLGSAEKMVRSLKIVMNDDKKAVQFAKAIDVLPVTASLPISSILKITPKLITPEIAKPIVKVTPNEIILNLKTT